MIACLSFVVTKASDTSTSQSLESTMKQSTTPLPMSPTSAIEITMDGSSSSVSTSDHVTTPLPMSPTSAIEVTMEGSSSPFSTSDPVTTSLLMSPTSSIEVTLDGSSPSVSTSDHVTSSVLSTTTGNSEPVGKCSSVNPKLYVKGSQKTFCFFLVINIFHRGPCHPRWGPYQYFKGNTFSLVIFQGFRSSVSPLPSQFMMVWYLSHIEQVILNASTHSYP